MTMLQFLAAIAPPLATLVSGVIALFALIDWIKARRRRKDRSSGR
jgi:hypothetical protein